MTNLDEIQILKAAVDNLTQRVLALETKKRKAPVKPRTKPPVQELDTLIRDSILEVRHVLFNVDLASSSKILAVMHELYPNEQLFNPGSSSRSFDKAAKSIGRRMSRIPEFTSLVTTQYIGGEIGNDLKMEGKRRQINSTIWCLRNLSKYMNFSPGELHREAQIQSDNVHEQWEQSKQTIISFM